MLRTSRRSSPQPPESLKGLDRRILTRRPAGTFRRLIPLACILLIIYYAAKPSAKLPVTVKTSTLHKAQDIAERYLHIVDDERTGRDDPVETSPQRDTPIGKTPAKRPTNVEELAKSFDFSRSDGRIVLPLATPGTKRSHPIPVLIDRAQKHWQDLKTRQSTTFRDAILEYRRRNGRNPPKGFDRWYAFCKRNKVLMIDEFDMISDAIRPFFALSPQNFRKRVDFVSSWFIVSFGFGLEIKDGKIHPFGNAKEHSRAFDFFDLVDRFAKDIPDCKLYSTCNDGPHIWLSGDERLRLEELVAKNEFDPKEDDDPEYLSKAYTPPIGPMPQTCPPETPMRVEGFEYGVAQNDTLMPPLPKGADMAFIGDVRAALDICRNPQIRHTHSAISWTFPLPGPHLPLFSPGVHGHFADLPTIFVEQFDPDEHDDTPWEERTDSRLLWRGQTSGPNWLRQWPWKSAHRARLHLLAQDGVGAPSKVHLDAANGSGIYDLELHPAVLNAAYLDVGMVGPAVQCDESDGTCDTMQRVFKGYKDRVSLQESKRYKFELDVDGNSWSGRFRRLMISSAVVFKATIFPAFWTSWAVPWVHYVPISVDYSDMWDVLAYFRGGLYGEDAHDGDAKAIAMAGQDFAACCLRWEDHEAYQFRLMLEYARLYSLDRKAKGSGPADYEGEGHDEPAPWRD